MDFIEKLMSSLGEGVNVDEIKTGLESHIESKVAEKMPELKKHADKLLDEAKMAKKELNAFKDSMKWLEDNELDSVKFKELKDEYEQLKASSATSSADIEAIKKEVFESGKKTKETELKPQLEKAMEEIELYKTKAKDNLDQLIGYQAESEINSVLDKMHIDPNPFIRQGIKSFVKTEYNELDKQLSISMFDPSQKKHIPISDWMNTFPNTDEGKAIIKAPINTGGGANGGAGSGSKDGKIDNAFEGMFK